MAIHLVQTLHSGWFDWIPVSQRLVLKMAWIRAMVLAFVIFAPMPLELYMCLYLFVHLYWLYQFLALAVLMVEWALSHQNLHFTEMIKFNIFLSIVFCFFVLNFRNVRMDSPDEAIDSNEESGARVDGNGVACLL